MPTVTKTLGEGTQSVLLTIAILECLASENRPISVSELSKQIGTSKSRVFRHLRTLLACDYVAQSEAGGQYGIGSRLQALCRSTSYQRDLGKIATPVMEQLSGRFRHSVIVSRIQPDGVHVIKSMSGHTSIVLEVRAATILSFDRSAQGKIALAFADDVATENMSSSFENARTKFATTNSGELTSIRQSGIATAQMREGLMGMAAPLFDADSRLVGTLAFLNTVAEMKEHHKEAESALKLAASAISSQLGFEAGARMKRDSNT